MNDSHINAMETNSNHKGESEYKNSDMIIFSLAKGNVLISLHINFLPAFRASRKQPSYISGHVCSKIVVLVCELACRRNMLLLRVLWYSIYNIVSLNVHACPFSFLHTDLCFSVSKLRGTQLDWEVCKR